MSVTTTGYKLLLKEVEKLLWDFLSQNGHTSEEYEWATSLEEYFASKEFTSLGLDAKVMQLNNSKTDLLELTCPEITNDGFDPDFGSSRWVKGTALREERERIRREEAAERNEALAREARIEAEKKAKAKKEFDKEKELMPTSFRLIRKVE